MYFTRRKGIFIIIIIIIFLIGICRESSFQESFVMRNVNELTCDHFETDWDTMDEWDTKEIPHAKNIMSEETRNQYYSLLKDIDEILNAHHLPYVLGAGTLLGSYRHGDIIPWDDDGDICIRYEDHDTLESLKGEFATRGIEIRGGCLSCWSGFYSEVCEYLSQYSKGNKHFEPPSMTKPCITSKYFAAFHRGKVHIDIFHLIPIYDKYNKKMYTIYGNNRLISEDQVNDMFNIVRCPFGPLYLNCPSNTKELLCHQYKNNLQFPQIQGIENKDLIPGMWSKKDKNTPHLMRDGEGYIFKNFK